MLIKVRTRYVTYVFHEKFWKNFAYKKKKTHQWELNWSHVWFQFQLLYYIESTKSNS